VKNLTSGDWQLPCQRHAIHSRCNSFVLSEKGAEGGNAT
jgi:hypothetical protein